MSKLVIMMTAIVKVTSARRILKNGMVGEPVSHEAVQPLKSLADLLSTPDDSNAFQFGFGARRGNRAAARYTDARLEEEEAEEAAEPAEAAPAPAPEPAPTGSVFPDDSSKYPFAASVIKEAQKTKELVDFWAVGLYQAAAKSNVLGSVAKDMAALESAWSSDVEFFLSSPARSDSEKMQMVDKLASTLKFKTKEATNFVKLVTKDKEMPLSRLPYIIESFAEILRKSYGIYFAKINTFQAFTPAQEKKLKETLEAYMGAGAEVQMEFAEEAALAGGFTISMEGMNFDLSLKSDLKRAVDGIQNTLEAGILAKMEAQEEALKSVQATHTGGGGMDWVEGELKKVADEVDALVSAR